MERTNSDEFQQQTSHACFLLNSGGDGDDGEASPSTCGLPCAWTPSRQRVVRFAPSTIVPDEVDVEPPPSQPATTSFLCYTEPEKAILETEEEATITETGSEPEGEVVPGQTELRKDQPDEARMSRCRRYRCFWLLMLLLLILLVIIVPVAIVVPRNSLSSVTINVPNLTDDEHTTGGNLSPETKECFSSTEDLHAAVDAYLLDNSSDSLTAVRYGWPINFWCLGNVTNLTATFSVQRNAALVNFTGLDVADWDTSLVTHFSSLFQGSPFHGQLRWNTSSGLYFDRMFQYTPNFNGNISHFDVSSAIDLSRMFDGALAFNQDVSGWEIDQVKTFRGMFRGAQSFRQDLCDWGPKLYPHADVTNAFDGTSCRLSGVDPDLSALPVGPFCAPCTFLVN